MHDVSQKNTIFKSDSAMPNMSPPAREGFQRVIKSLLLYWNCSQYFALSPFFGWFIPDDYVL